MPVILLVGNDHTLQQTRAAVLRTIGVEIVEADSVSAAHVQSERLFDLLLLCHSVPEEAAATIARTFNAQSAFTPILRISVQGGCDPSEEDGFDTITSAQPQRLVNRVAEVLGIRTSKSAAA